MSSSSSLTQTSNIDSAFIYAPPQQPLAVCYDDEDLIAIHKPAGLLSVMGRLPEHQDSAYWRILQQFPQAKVIHRLDMATSGILLFAKHRQAEVGMSKAFQARQVQKTYHAIVLGELTGSGIIDVPLIADWVHRPRQKVDWQQGKAAQTHYRALAYHAEAQVTLVQLQPITGRSHQLRVHLAHEGYPILGDRLYTPLPMQQSRGFGKHYTGQMLLHATQLIFQHPLTQQRVDIQSLPPEPFNELFPGFF